MDPTSYLLSLAKSRDVSKFQTTSTLSSAAIASFLMPGIAQSHHMSMNSRVVHALYEIQLAEAILAGRQGSTIKRLPALSAEPSSSSLVQSRFDMQATTSNRSLEVPQVQPDISHLNRLKVVEALKVARSIPCLTKDDGSSSTGVVSSHSESKSRSQSSPEPGESVDEVFNADVLCGRGGKSNHHPGNKRYRQVISQMKSGYRQIGNKTAKTDLSRAIVDHVYEYGGRFLRYEKAIGKFIVLTPSEARKKTSQALREAKDVKWVS